MGLLLLIVLIVFLVGGLPNWGYHCWCSQGILGTY